MNHKSTALSAQDVPLSSAEIKAAFLVLLVTLVSPFTTDGYTPSLPAIASALHVSAHTMQLTITLYLLGSALSQLVFGPLSDHYGRRKIILAGLGICTVGTVLCIISPSASWLLFARFIQGLGAGSGNSVFRAIMRDMFEGRRMAKISNYLSMAYTLTLAIAPILGGHVQDWFGWRANFSMAALLCVGILFIISLRLPETLQEINRTVITPRGVIKNYIILLKSREFIGYALCASIAIAGFMAYYAIAPFLLQEVIGLTPSQYGWLSLCLPLGLILGQLVNAKLLNFFMPTDVLRYGIHLMTISGVILLGGVTIFGIHAWIVVIATIIFTAATGFVFGNAMTGAFHSFAHIAGSAGAIYGSVQIGGSFLISFVLSHLSAHNPFLLGFTYFFLGLMAWGMLKTLLPSRNS